MRTIWLRYAAPRFIHLAALLLVAGAATVGSCADRSERLMDVLIKKGILTKEEADQLLAEEPCTNLTSMSQSLSKWKISDAIKQIELFGEVKLRFEQRQANVPDGRIELDRARYALRLGLRGDVFDNFYYGLRLETGSNPRSPWVTFGTSSSGVPYLGPYGKSTAGIELGQLYIGWRPASWVDLTVGKMPNPLYTTPMVWDTDISPEGAAERFKYTVGEADFFLTFGQFLYADVNPSYASGGLGVPLVGQQNDTPFQLAWQGGVNYHITTNVSAKVAATLYHYLGVQTNISPYFGDTFVGEGAFTGKASDNPINGASGYGSSGGIPGQASLGFPNNQVGLDHLLIVEVPAELNFRLSELDYRLFGNFAYNLEGRQRAEVASAAYANYLANQLTPPTISGFAPQRNDVMAYQLGFALGNMNSLGLVYGQPCRKHSWEFRTYWQHIEQYALDPNILDSDFFEGRANLEGVYVGFAYALTGNVISTVRYGYARRINDKLGTGGSNLDLPQVNPIDRFNLLQLDLTLRF